MNLADTTRLVVKSLVLSSPDPLTIDQLDRDYEKQEGRRIPYAQLGHANLKSYLLSMPDTLAYDSARRTFTLASDEGGKSEHILKVVSGRKSNRRKNNNSKPSTYSNNSNRFNNNNNNGKNREITIWDQHPLNYNNVNYTQPFINQLHCSLNALPTNQTRPFEPGNLLDPPSYIRGSILGAPPPSLMSLPVQRPVITTMKYVPPHQRPKKNQSKNDTVKSLPVQRPVITTMKYVPPHQRPKKNQSKNDTVKIKSTSKNVEPTPPPNIKRSNDDADIFDGGKSDSSSEEINALPPMDDEANG